MIDLPAKTNLTALALSDPLSKETDAKRTQVLFLACTCTLLGAFGLRVTKTPWLEIEVPQGAPSILTGALTSALVYVLLMFLWHAATDLGRWWLSREAIELRRLQEWAGAYGMHLGGIRDLLVNIGSCPDRDAEGHSGLLRNLEAANAHWASLLDDVRAFRTVHAGLTLAQALRIALLDIGFPLALSVLALTKTGTTLLPFLGALLK